MTLFGWLRKINGTLAHRGNSEHPNTSAQRRAAARPCLEQLEDRVTPTTFDTITNVAISIDPSIGARSATETITATVTQAGTTTPVTSGNVFFNVNGKTESVALNGAGQATFTTSLPLYAVASNQTPQAFYQGTTTDTDTFNSSAFLSPVYLNVLNAIFPSNITFVGPPLSQTTLPVNPYGSYKGETDNVSLFAIPVVFNYVDPGTIETFNLFGLTLSGSFSGTLFGPYEAFYISLGTQLI